MSEPFVGEIRMFAGNFAPRSWAFCQGQLLAISQNDALFSLLGTIYGGDGRTTFGLPDMRGRIPIHQGQGPGLSDYRIGSRAGVENVTLTLNQIPSHNHAFQVSTAGGSQDTPAGGLLATSGNAWFQTGTPSLPMSSSQIAQSGGSQSHTNIQPFIAINYIIALFGIYPSRS